MVRQYDRKLMFEDGTEYPGWAFGAETEKVCEIVFNTSMVGYQEILSDPSYACQAVVMTYPIIGSYGMAAEDYETDVPAIGAMIVSEYNDRPSNFRSGETLGAVMERFGIPGISGVDTRKLTRSIRDKGSRKVLITAADTERSRGLEILKTTRVPADGVARVSPREKRVWNAPRERFRVAAIDCGMKRNIPRSLNRLGCTVIGLPYDTPPEAVRALEPDGVFLSNGPGDPRDVLQVIKTVRSLRGQIPMFGICLGHQMISLAYGADCYKLKFGHRGSNHPVRNLETGRIEITSQNHSYAVELSSLKDTELTPTHINLLDGTVEGVCCRKDRVFSVQYHPESAPGPEDSAYLFRQFIRWMEEGKNHG